MAKKELVNQIVKLYQKLGGNISDVLGTRTNVSFIGKGEPEILKMDLNTDALGALPQSKALEELKDSVQFAAGDKLNDLQAGKLLENMSKMDEFYNPAAAPANVTDLATRTRNLDAEGLMSLRKDNVPFPEVENYMPAKKRFFRGVEIKDPTFDEDLPFDNAAEKLAEIKMSNEAFEQSSKLKPIDEVQNFTKSKEDVVQDLVDRKFGKGYFDTVDDVSAPTGAGLEAIKSVKNNSLIVDDLVDKVYQMSGVAENAKPVARANARDFLNRIKDMEDPDFPGGTTLSGVMETDDLRFATEGGGGGLGDPLLLVQKYFGPKVASAVAKLDSPNDIQQFAENLVKIKDARGNSVTSRFFDPESVSPDDFEFAEGGRVPMFAGGVARMGYQALRKYGIEAKDISRLFASLGSDKSLVGKEKTEYFRNLHKVLRNPDDYPDGIKEIQIRLGIDPIGFKSGGLAGILEV